MGNKKDYNNIRENRMCSTDKYREYSEEDCRYDERKDEKDFDSCDKDYYEELDDYLECSDKHDSKKHHSCGCDECFLQGIEEGYEEGHEEGYREGCKSGYEKAKEEVLTYIKNRKKSCKKSCKRRCCCRCICFCKRRHCCGRR